MLKIFFLLAIPLVVFGMLPDYAKLKNEVIAIEQEIAHPQTALEDAITQYVINKLKEEIRKVAREEAEKILEELKPKWS